MQQAQGAGAREVGRAAAPHLVITYQSFFSDPGNRREVCDGRSEQNINSVNYNTKL